VPQHEVLVGTRLIAPDKPCWVQEIGYYFGPGWTVRPHFIPQVWGYEAGEPQDLLWEGEETEIVLGSWNWVSVGLLLPSGGPFIAAYHRYEVSGVEMDDTPETEDWMYEEGEWSILNMWPSSYCDENGDLMIRARVLVPVLNDVTPISVEPEGPDVKAWSQVVPRVTVKNLAQTAPEFLVRVVIEELEDGVDTVYDEAETAPGLDFSETAVVEFPSWSVGAPFARYRLTAFTSYEADEVAGNDTISVELIALGITDQIGDWPSRFILHQPRPNPFTRTTEIAYDLPKDCQVSLRVYDATGRLVKTLVSGVELAGYRSVTWNGTDAQGRRVASGVYFYHFVTEEFSGIRKLVLTR
jgi:hypothetical protein